MEEDGDKQDPKYDDFDEEEFKWDEKDYEVDDQDNEQSYGGSTQS